MVFYGLGTHISITLLSNEELRLREVKSLHKDLHIEVELGFPPSLTESEVHILISLAEMSHLKNLSDISW